MVPNNRMNALPVQATQEPPGVLPFDPSTFAHATARIIEVAGIAVIVLGAALATALFLHHLYQYRQFSEAYSRYRSNLGRGILLGLELLVAADIIRTVAVDPTFRSLGVLGLIVVIRTFLSFALEVEINGHWPWEAAERAPETREDAL